MTLATILNNLLTIACMVGLFGLGILISILWRAVRRDCREADEERKRELRDWEENQ